jgi:hypothetical protein
MARMAEAHPTSERPDPHANESMVGPHGQPDDHGQDAAGDHGHDDHAHEGMEPGPIDVRAWGALVGGVALGLLVVLALIQALA